MSDVMMYFFIEYMPVLYFIIFGRNILAWLYFWQSIWNRPQNKTEYIQLA